MRLQHLCLYVLISIVFLHTYGFTRQDRIVEANFVLSNGELNIIHIDPFVISIDRLTSLICSEIGCSDETQISKLSKELTNLYLTEVLHRMRSSHDSYKLGIHEKSTAGWLRLASDSMRQKMININLEVIDLSNGILNPRILCHHEGETKQYSRHCALDYYSYILLNADSPTLDHFILLGEMLFNSEQYSYAEAIASFSLTMLWLDENKNIDLNDGDLKKAILLMTEASRAQGNLAASTHFSASMLSFMNFTDSKRFLYRLRTMLSLPTIPPDYHTSELARVDIIDDLKKLIEEIDIINLRISLTEVSGDVQSTPFYIAHQGLNDVAFVVTLAQVFQTFCPELIYVSPHLQASSNHHLTNRRIAVGFISNYFFDQSIGRIMLDVMYFLREDFDVTIFFVDRLGRSDPITQLYTQLFGDKYIRISPNTVEARFVIESSKLDILVYTDIGMDFSTYLLAFSRLATYQIAWWGHPISSGVTTIDYFFGLDIEVSLANEHYTEQLIRFEFMPISPVEPFKQIDNKDLSYLNLPVNAKYCLILGRLFKIHPIFDELLFKLLQILPANMYVVMIAEPIAELNQQLYSRFLNTLNSTILSERIIFMDYMNYQQILLHAECVLDTFPYGGCLTIHDALSNSIPVVTLPMEYVRGRYAYGMYKQMQHYDLIATDIQHYAEIALQLMVNETFRTRQSTIIYQRFHESNTSNIRLKRNKDVAKEWGQVFMSLLH